jgi:pyruvate kinase
MRFSGSSADGVDPKFSRPANPRTQIICTLGPASDPPGVLRRMVAEGMDVARLNFSHGTHEEHAARIARIRRCKTPSGSPIRILQDLEGYRIRMGTLPREIPLRKGQVVRLTNRSPGKGLLPFDYPGPLTDIKSGSPLYIDDGNIALLAKVRTKDVLDAEVVLPGTVKSHKGVNIPNLSFRMRGLTEKDREDLEFGVRHKVDFIAQSFVRDRKDILAIRDHLRGRLPECQIVAKIENWQGIRHLDEILDEADGIMIARGDMGVSVPIYEIAYLQKMIIKKCARHGKFAITATQMLESMVLHHRPTRAEVTDVANAILDGSDFLMLSEETAAGNHPVEAVRMMDQIIVFTEGVQHRVGRKREVVPRSIPRE